jgi:hypothetical protein
MYTYQTRIELRTCCYSWVVRGGAIIVYKHGCTQAREGAAVIQRTVQTLHPQQSQEDKMWMNETFMRRRAARQIVSTQYASHTWLTYEGRHASTSFTIESFSFKIALMLSRTREQRIAIHVASRARHRAVPNACSFECSMVQ